MIETPRAALRAGEIAEEADFFSFGTNDLTQMTFGFSRDDVEGRMMSAYLEKGLLKRNPFEVVDPDGVGRAGPAGRRAGPGHPARPQDRGLRRARRRSRVDRHLRRGRARLRELLALPGAHRPAGRRPGRAGRCTPPPGPATGSRQPARPRRQGRPSQGARAKRPSGGPARRERRAGAGRSRPTDAVPSRPWASPTRTWPGSGRRPTSSP